MQQLGLRLLMPVLTACTAAKAPPAFDCATGEGCAGDHQGGSGSGDVGGEGGDDGSDTGSGDDGGDTGGDLPDTDHCDVLDDFGTGYDSTVATWVAQDDLDPAPEAPLVFTGSSSIRRWEGLARAYADHAPVQRGFGGAQLAEVAVWSEELVSRHAPAGVVVFAGTNDVAFGVDADTVVARLRCLRERLWIAHGRALPVLFIGITPTPSRWEQWETASAVNDAVASLAADDPGLVYVDVPSAFLATSPAEGEPPSEALFVSDLLHLSPEGYALWDSVLRPAVEDALEAKPPASSPSAHPDSGARILVDFGASDGTNGEHSASPDHLGQHWNNWHDLAGGASVLPGEHLGQLLTSEGDATGIDLVITGGFANNGRQNGGLLWPDAELLGQLAVGTATQDYFYSVDDDNTGGLYLRGLDPARTYTLRLFAGRDDPELRETTYTLHGAGTQQASLQTSGPGAGSEGRQGNDDDLVIFEAIEPDAWGQIFVDVSLATGSYAYLALLELEVE